MQNAVEQFKEILGSEYVRTGVDCAEFGQCTSHEDVTVGATVFPANIVEVQAIVAIARKHKLKILPISSGKNWGYGSAALHQPEAIIMHLGRMNHILSFDTALGIAHIEPGVTQQQLFDYIKENNLPYMTPVTGSSPDCSIMSNALERGYGIIPISDHFEAITSLTAVLGNGEIYEPCMHEAGGGVSNTLYKWGIGPYVDGLFYRGHFGIVTSVTITLTQTPASMQMLFAEPKSKEDAFALLNICRDFQTSYGINLHGTKLFNGDYLRMINNLPINAGRYVPAWGMIGCIYGHETLHAPIRKLMTKRMKPHCTKLAFVTEKRLKLLEKISSSLPTNLRVHVDSIFKAFPFYRGVPNEMGLAAAYWQNDKPATPPNLNPARDGCGVMWYAPIIPNTPEDLAKLEKMVLDICNEYNIRPVLNLTCSKHYIYGLIMLVYNKATMSDSATLCKNKLIEEGRQYGWLPYRMHHDDMRALYLSNSTNTQQLAALKTAWDPDNILANL